MMLELFLVNLFKENGIKLYKTIPSSLPMPYSVYDRLSGEPDLYHKYCRGSFAIDIYGKSMEQIDDQFSKIKKIFKDLEKSDDRFIQADIYNFIDNTIDEKSIVYTLYVDFLHIEDL